LNYHSQRRAGGSLILELSVLDPEGNTMDGAVVTGFVYPDGNPAAGRGAAFSATSRDSQMAWVQPPAGNSLEVAVRVKRAGAADELLFFGLEPEPKPQHTGRGCHGMQ
jgi:hypothetical protein